MISFAAPFIEPAGSPIRELFPYLSRAGMISFAGGYPSTSLFDAEGLQQAASQALGLDGRNLQYGPTEGDAALRAALAALSQARGIRCKAPELLVTSGSQQAFDLLLKVFIEPGDTVCVETPAYPAALQALRLAGANIVPVPVDGDGLQVEVLAERLRSAPAGRRPKLLYTVPTFSNPCGTLLPDARRAQLVQLAREHGFLIVEDDPYGELSFSDTGATQPLRAHGEAEAGGSNPVIYLSSLSKTVAPALRIGWLIASADVLRRCAIAKQTNDMCTSPLTQAIATLYLQSGRYRTTVERARAEYRRRMQALVQSLQAELGAQLGFVEPRGGMFLWARGEGAIDRARLFEAAVEAGVLYVPGAAFYASEPDLQTMRLSFAAPDVEQIREGSRRLAQAFRSAML